MMPGASYSLSELHALRRFDVTLPRPVRKTIFSHRLWRPWKQRQHVERQHRSGFSQTPSIDRRSTSTRRPRGSMPFNDS